MSPQVKRRGSPSSLLAALALAACAAGGHREAEAPRAPVHVQLLALNDFHGQITAGREVRGRPAGSAGVLAAWLAEARRGRESETVLVHAGDLVGASPAASSLLRDEPTIELMNELAGPGCRGPVRPATPAPPSSRCDVVGTLGNHELDHGLPALRRLLGGDPGGAPWPGARYPTVSANVIDARTGAPVFPPYAVVEVNGVRVAFVGAILRGAATMVAAGRIEGLAFTDEADAVNRLVPEIRARGVRAIVVLLHQGGEQRHYEGPTRLDAPPVRGAVDGIVARLDPAVDVVVSGHVHAFTNAFLPSRTGKPVLVTQAFSAGTAFASIDLAVDARGGEVVGRSARVVTAWADAGPGRAPEPGAEAIARRAEARVATLTARVVTVAAEPLPTSGEAGGSPLGLLVADAHRAALSADVAFMNAGGVRAGLPAGPVTWGALYAAQPFGNQLVRLTLTGGELVLALEQQWRGHGRPAFLSPSGLTFTFSAGAPAGHKVSAVRVNGSPLDQARHYTVAVNEFLAGGGDGFTVFAHATERVMGPDDLEALEAYLRAAPRPLRAPAGGRLTLVPASPAQ